MKCIARLIYEDKMWFSDVRTGDNKPVNITLESGSFDALIERLKMVIPEMLEEVFNYVGEVELLFEVERKDNIRPISWKPREA